MSLVTDDVPVHEYLIEGRQVYVVRDDLCCPFPGNNNSKSRGVYNYIKNLDNDVIGVIDSKVSRAGWGVAWLASKLGKKVYLYIDKGYIDHFFRLMAKLHGAVIVPFTVKRIRIGYYMAKKDVESKGGVMLPLYLKLLNTVSEVYRLASNVLPKYDARTVVISVGSGTIASGIVRAADKCVVYGICHSDASLVERYRTIELFSGKRKGIELIRMGYTYGEPNYNVVPPFPSDLYYDRWAWQWLVENVGRLKDPIIFWNVGGEWHHETGMHPMFRGDGVTSREEVVRWVEGRRLIQQIPT